jgi:hypothetical protein
MPLIAFMPWMRLPGPIEVGGVRWFPAYVDDKPAPELQGILQSVNTILGGYVDIDGRPINTAAIAQLPDRAPWELTDDDLEIVAWSRLLLSLAAISSNCYFTQLGSYTNSACFGVVYQRFTAPAGWVTVIGTRLDGRAEDGGYQHADLRLTPSMSARHSLWHPVQIDLLLLDALERESGSSATLKGLRRALPFFAVATSDSEILTGSQEAIVMGPAFAHLLDADSQGELAKAFHERFERFGSVTAATARSTRPHIPNVQTNEEQWWIHRIWVRELYKARSKAIHKEGIEPYTWGWTVREHLVMAAFVFPLLVKVLLASEGHYTLTQTDIAHCHAVDPILASPRWEGPAVDEDGDITSDSVWLHHVKEAERQERQRAINDAIETMLKESDSGDAPPDGGSDDGHTS